MYPVRMRKKVVTIGNSAGITISPAELHALGIGPGDTVEVTVRAGVLEVRAVSRYEDASLPELMAVINAARTRS
ncbi:MULTISPECIES: AbrB/MazE/SpoVT family DNA-binding domain-containing protein [unclassified Frankia]|uniref:AbrB/MazE/SpoVT family DNA-binding domain-containing protein n=1 Tax=unclassified Frankia TaxID=2632575 RepID=UPI00202562E3